MAEQLMKCIDVPNKEATIAKAHTAVLWNAKSHMEQHIIISLTLNGSWNSEWTQWNSHRLQVQKVKLTLTQMCYNVKGSFLENSLNLLKGGGDGEISLRMEATYTFGVLAHDWG